MDRYDARVKAMELDERPTEQYSDIGGVDKQIQEGPLSVIFILLTPVYTSIVDIVLSFHLHSLLCFFS